MAMTRAVTQVGELQNTKVRAAIATALTCWTDEDQCRTSDPPCRAVRW